MQRPYKGYLINLEGGEGSGKTTQIPLLVEHLRGLGCNIYPTREPGGTSIGEQIREVIHSLKNTEMHPHTETLLYQAARAQMVEQILRPKLAEGTIVILDRFFDSTLAYQGYGHQQDIGQTQKLVDYATGGLIPDLTVLLDVELEIGLSRRRGTKEWNRMDSLSVDFYERVRSGYLEMAKADINRWVVIDANQNVEGVQSDLRRVVQDKLLFHGLIEGNRFRVER